MGEEAVLRRQGGVGKRGWGEGLLGEKFHLRTWSPGCGRDSQNGAGRGLSAPGAVLISAHQATVQVHASGPGLFKDRGS